ncbi:beta-lactamase [Maritalea myrionectae]|uniref:Beta-lactamase n=1 Tax=Maritalea myrionectae TaxID=454601 RepID=A0A2R4MB76_9HYPH|nr:alpha/beta hydrolase [Maritalea myrionectae]AVX03223.1 beta-lactamase [Maritalea myrionectae]
MTFCSTSKPLSLFAALALFFASLSAPQQSFAGTEFEVEGNIVHMDYEITSRTYNQFVRLHQKNPQVDTILMHEIDGSTDDEVMIKLGYYLRKHGFKTKLHSESEIYSGGVDLFLAGVERTMERGAIIGVHSWSDGERDGADYPRSSPEHDMNRNYIKAMLGRDGFYWFTLEAAPADDIHIMSEGEIRKYRLLTKPIGAR